MAAEKNAKGLYEVRIGEHVYEFEKWGAEDSLEALLKIAKLAAKPLGQAIGAFAGSGDTESLSNLVDRDIRPDMIAGAFSALTESLNEREAMALIKQFSTKGILVDGAKMRGFNAYYRDDLGLVFKVVAAGLEVQYSNFSKELLALVASIRPRRSTVVTSGGPTGDPSSEAAAVSTK